jgi:hypothetical protein
MNLYIETENGQIKNHPASEHNLIQAFGAIPSHWEPFIRIERPTFGVYQTMDSTEPVYAKINGVWTDVWSVRDMTAEEIAAKQQRVKDNWTSLPNKDNFTAWQFNETTCSFEPPVPYPENGNYKWSGADSAWVELTP